MQPPIISGNGQITMPSYVVGAPKVPFAYLGMAINFLIGAKILSNETPGNAISLAFLSAQAAECGLKAFLSRSGDDERLTKNPHLRHNLAALWCLAAKEGLSIDKTPPPWLTVLSEAHCSPYALRYSKGINGIQTPAPQPMGNELNALIKEVERQIEKNS
ncbi:hypothetical protein [Janthinobacterium sp. EB271-G4-7A]|uniref:hypothetical protein n=1 Tax=Janthinobacterium sp. EB271-G4-7A TaxID=2775056 RepID=UPI001E4BA6A1|nr:hypothetical protein [Janthinobacterium sp. EB271-G4-7A]MCC7695108.1 hypothetical protein [Janthinobacterium sp. EB271-G4-7A]